MANLVKNWNPDFILTLGDNNYDLGDSTTIDQNIGQYYHEYIYNYKGRYGPKTFSERFFPSLGNHDYYTRNGQPYRDYFTLPGNGRYYDFVRGHVHFFALNSAPAEPDGISATSRQARWLQAALAASTARWNVVYLHHALYSSGPHGNTTVMQWPFRTWGASLVPAGHDHTYERLQVDSLAYLVNGLGGRSIYASNRPRLPQSQRYFNGNYGALLLDATPDSLAMRFFTRQRVLRAHRFLRAAPAPEPRPQTLPRQPQPVAGIGPGYVFAARPAGGGPAGAECAGPAGGYPAPGPGGWHRVPWARNGLAAGLYYVQLQGSGFSQVVKVQLD